MKKVLTFALIGAAVAGVVYLLKDNDTVKDWLGKAESDASDGYSEASDGYAGLREKANTAVSEIA